MQLFKRKNGRAAEKPHKNGRGDGAGPGIGSGAGLGPDGKVYRPSDKEPFMNERQREYFRLKLLDWREGILQKARRTLHPLQDQSQKKPQLPAPAASRTHRATQL